MDQPSEGSCGTQSPSENDNGLRYGHVHMHVALHRIHVPRQNSADDALFS